MSNDVRTPPGDADLERRLRATFAAVMPLLDPATRDASRPEASVVESFELRGLDAASRPRRSVLVAGTLAVAASAVGLAMLPRDSSTESVGGRSVPTTSPGSGPNRDPPLEVEARTAVILAALPGTGWITLAEQPGAQSAERRFSAFDAAGRQIAIYYVPDPSTVVGALGGTSPSFPVGDDLTVGYAKPDGSALVVSAQGDGAIASCVALDGACLAEGVLAEVSTAELAEAARRLLPLLRQNSHENNPFVVYDQPGARVVDWNLAEEEFKAALGVGSIDMRIDGRVTWASNARDPITFKLADGTSVVSGFVGSGELVRVHVDGTIPADELVAAMHVMISTLDATSTVPSTTVPG